MKLDYFEIHNWRRLDGMAHGLLSVSNRSKAENVPAGGLKKLLNYFKFIIYLNLLNFKF